MKIGLRNHALYFGFGTALFSYVGAATASDGTEQVRDLMASPAKISTWEIKGLWSLGDEVAIDLIRMYDEASLAQPGNLRTVLWILDRAFENREWIANSEDRQPRAAVFLLRVLERDASDERYRARIAGLIKRLESPEGSADLARPSCDDPLAVAVTPRKLRRPAPKLALKDSAGRPVRWADPKGSVVLLSLWDGRSKVQVDYLNDLQSKYKESGLEVVGVWMDRGGWNASSAYLDRAPELRPNYPVGLGGADVARAFSVSALPMAVLIDREGRIAVSQPSDGTGIGPYYCSYEGYLKVLLAEAGPKRLLRSRSR